MQEAALFAVLLALTAFVALQHKGSGISRMKRKAMIMKRLPVKGDGTLTEKTANFLYADLPVLQQQLEQRMNQGDADAEALDARLSKMYKKITDGKISEVDRDVLNALYRRDGMDSALFKPKGNIQFLLPPQCSDALRLWTEKRGISRNILISGQEIALHRFSKDKLDALSDILLFIEKNASGFDGVLAFPADEYPITEIFSENGTFYEKDASGNSKRLSDGRREQSGINARLFDPYEQRRIRFNEKEYVLMEWMMQLEERNENGRFGDKNRLVALPDGERESVCVQCVKILKQTTDNGCLKCEPTLIKRRNSVDPNL